MERTEKIMAIAVIEAFSSFETKLSDIQVGLGAIK